MRPLRTIMKSIFFSVIQLLKKNCYIYLQVRDKVYSLSFTVIFIICNKIWYVNDFLIYISIVLHTELAITHKLNQKSLKDEGAHFTNDLPEKWITASYGSCNPFLWNISRVNYIKYNNLTSRMIRYWRHWYKM